MLYIGASQIISNVANHAILEVTNCTFTLNTGQIGGAIYSKDTFVTILTSKFTTNTAATYGGAIAVYFSSDYIAAAGALAAPIIITYTIKRNLFQSNTVTDFGAAIAMGYTTSLVTISENTFNGNTGYEQKKYCTHQFLLVYFKCKIRKPRDNVKKIRISQLNFVIDYYNHYPGQRTLDTISLN